MLTTLFLAGINNVEPDIPLIIGSFVVGIFVGMFVGIIIFVLWRRRESTSNTIPQMEKHSSDIERESIRGTYFCILPQFRRLI